MTSEQPKQPAAKPGGGGALWSRMIAGAAGAALAVFIIERTRDSWGAWGGYWFAPLCGGLGAIAGMVVDYYLLSGKDDGKPS